MGMMPKLPSINLYPGDWLRDEVAGCSLGAQGLWLRMMFIAHDSERYGYLSLNGQPMSNDFIARRCGSSVTDYVTLLSELDHASVPSRTPEGIIYSRRMVRDAKARLDNARRQKEFRKRNSNGNVTALSHRSSSSSSSSPSGRDPPSPRKRPKSDELPEIPESLRSPAFEEWWEKWIEHRRQKRSKLTPLAAEQQLKECEEWGEGRSIAAMRHSIGKGYTGLFELKENRPNVQKQRRVPPDVAEQKIREEQQRQSERIAQSERAEADRQRRIKVVKELTPEERERIRAQLILDAPNDVIRNAMKKADPASGGRMTDLIYAVVVAPKLAEMVEQSGA